ncbi:unnamed protein product (macronuclear) [Paramecium tetraurelia]|uniref:EGF-like domain-containing protein n=1 Tax=Paramecium tetraurelia TaxID=5888 RepID=A0BGR5_PARTE|nr:uncharacterized protein GSPATT00028767001 [Paramecium tetraurelia]CAK57732.1 unnamed protein product [Paramecium tetraurelia]|eukprot:XP_001425130.1 hypothetical protein (macronuclear) [Paramecium tetraurelia strain d4-2]
MFCYIILLVIVAKCRLTKQINLHQSENSLNQWSEESISSNSFYTLPAGHSYYSIDVTLEHEDQTFLLIQLDIKENSFTQYDQQDFEYVTISSYLDGQLERHIIVYNKHHKQTNIQVFSQNNTKYKITITAMKKLGNNCLNQCNHHGLCQKQKCECFSGYFGDDCHSQVFKFSDTKDLNLNVPEQMQYYVMDLKEQKKQVEISFILENYEDLKLTFFNDIKQQSQTILKEGKKVMYLLLEFNFSEISKSVAIFAAEKNMNKNQYFLAHIKKKEVQEGLSFTNKITMGIVGFSISILLTFNGPVVIQNVVRCCCS